MSNQRKLSQRDIAPDAAAILERFGGVDKEAAEARVNHERKKLALKLALQTSPGTA